MLSRLHRPILLLLLLLAPRIAAAQQPAVEIPNTPIAAHVAALFDAIAAGTEDAARAFIAEHMDPGMRDAFPMEQHLGMFRQWRERFGRPVVTGYREISSTEAEVEFRPENGSGARIFEISFTPEPPHRLVGLQGRPAGQPGAGAAGNGAADPVTNPHRPIDDEVRGAVVESVAAAMERHHLFPDTGQAIAARLWERARAGAYDEALTAQQLAVALTQDVQSVNPDKHVNVRATPPMQQGGPGGAAPANQVGRTERLAGDVGYVQLTGVLSGAPAALDEVASAFRELGDTRAMILDLRGVPGGSGEMANFIVSHFTAPRTHTITRVTPASGDTLQIYTLDDVPGPRRVDIPLYALVNGGSASAAEHIPFVLQNLGRATIVGERTPGAGRNNRFVDVGNGFAISVSFTRVTEPGTGREWERIGIQPDIAVPAADALQAAHRAALETLLATSQDAGTRAELERALAALPAAPAAGSGATSPAPGGSPELTALLERLRAEHGLPALAAAIVRGGEVIDAGATGVRRIGEPAPVANTDRFYTGSLTKPMTNMLIGTLVDEGKIRWDSTLGELFPELRDAMTPAFRGATVEQLLTHRAGLPTFTRLGPEEARLFQSITGTPAEQRAQFAAWLLTQEPVAQPGTEMNYSNAGYALSGAIADRVAGRPWEELIQSRVFSPLGIRSAGFGAPGQIEPGQPWGHMGARGAYTPAPGFGPSSAIMRPAGGVSMTIEDLARFAAAHIAEIRGAGRVIRPETALRLYDTADITFAGGNGMHTAMIALRPENNTAIVVATNAGAPEALQEVIRALW